MNLDVSSPVVAGAAAGIALLATWAIYAKIIKARNNAQEALAGIDTYLTQRHDLIPNLVATANRYMSHEKELLEEVTKLRSQAVDAGAASCGSAGRMALESKLGAALGALSVRMEAYPDLKADRTMTDLMASMNEVEGMIAAARRSYNAAVKQLNGMTQIWPMSWVAKLVGVSSMGFYEASEQHRQNVDVKSMFNS